MTKLNPREVAQELRVLDRKDVPLHVCSAIEKAISALEGVDASPGAPAKGGLRSPARTFLYPDMPDMLGRATPSVDECWCETCRPITLLDSRMVLCPTCGNKRCPHATDHRNECTGSNEPGQTGSSWEHVRPWSDSAPPAGAASRQPAASVVETLGSGADVASKTR